MNEQARKLKQANKITCALKNELSKLTNERDRLLYDLYKIDSLPAPRLLTDELDLELVEQCLSLSRMMKLEIEKISSELFDLRFAKTSSDYFVSMMWKKAESFESVSYGRVTSTPCRNPHSKLVAVSIFNDIRVRFQEILQELSDNGITVNFDILNIEECDNENKIFKKICDMHIPFVSAYTQLERLNNPVNADLEELYFIKHSVGL